MKTWKIVTLVGLAVIVAALVVTTAFAYTGGQAISAVFGTYGYHGGYGGSSSYGTRGGMMGSGYTVYGNGQYLNGYCQQGPYPQQYALGGYGGCR
jgi:hypothetical protein